MKVNADPASTNPLTLIPDNQIQSFYQHQLHQGYPYYLLWHRIPLHLLDVVLFVIVIGFPPGVHTLSEPSKLRRSTSSPTMMYWQERTDTSKSTFNPKIGTTPPSRWGQRQGLVVGEEILWDRILIDPSFYSLGQIRPGSIRQRLAVGVRVSNQIPNRNPTPRRHRCCCRHHSPHVFLKWGMIFHVLSLHIPSCLSILYPQNMQHPTMLTARISGHR